MPSMARSTLARPARRRGDYQRPQINDGSFLRIGYNSAKRAMSSALIAHKTVTGPPESGPDTKATNLFIQVRSYLCQIG